MPFPSAGPPADPPPTPSPPAGRQALLAAAHAELEEHGHAHISLRAVARRAGVSHAAPKYHFQDRAGLLTAVATAGYDDLTKQLHQAVESASGMPLADLGKAYIDYGLAHPALFDLMFRPTELRPDDPELGRARAGSLSVLVTAVQDAAGAAAPPEVVTELALTSWSLVHGLVTLTRDGALPETAGAHDPTATTELTHRLADLFTSRVFAQR